ncbi:MAG: TatD family hydrolase [Candidatus Aminicenantes bacterium]|nr:TatD family hydrolase [Candidatus Aminicenantes bacterium]
MNYMDFHCHLDMKAFDLNREEIAAEFFNSGFSRLVTAADPYEPGSFETTREILSYHKNIYCTAGAHPHGADRYTPAIEKAILRFLPESGAVAVGEAGLDFHYNLSTPENQLQVFKRQIAIARELQLPLVIHSREAEALVLQTLEGEKFQFPVVFHCYTGNMADAKEIVKRGYYLSFSGIVTFRQKKTDYLRDIVREVPLDRLFTETDSPYLAPEPFRGKPNTPLLVRYVAEKVAEIKGIPVEELNRCIDENFGRLCPNCPPG